MPADKSPRKPSGKPSAAAPNKPWGGRFAEETDVFLEHFSESVSFDQRLWRQDIQGSLAHVSMLGEAGVLRAEEVERIRAGLRDIEKDLRAGRFEWSTGLEDVHMNIEAELVKRVGEVGKKLHTGRSRNDQVATDMRLWLREEVRQIQTLLLDLEETLLGLAAEHKRTVMPGFTHLQIAQPVTFGHHLLAWCEMFLRDHDRLDDCARRMNVLPLGAAALAGTSFPIQREQVAQELGFDGVMRNSLDAVSDRDFLIEFAAAASMIMMHLSRGSEELILWMSAPFSWIELGDSWCTGSSIMPQKKNPDVPELIRGKTARAYADLHGLLVLMKAQPLAYNRDNQEDKEFLFDAADTVRLCLRAFAGMLGTLTVHKDRMRDSAALGYSTATDLADYLTGKQVPFRDAHEITGKIVRAAMHAGKRLDQMSLAELREFSPLIEEDVRDALSVEGSVAARRHVGGTAPEQVSKQISSLRRLVKKKRA